MSTMNHWPPIHLIEVKANVFSLLSKVIRNGREVVSNWFMAEMYRQSLKKMSICWTLQEHIHWILTIKFKRSSNIPTNESEPLNLTEMQNLWFQSKSHICYSSTLLFENPSIAPNDVVNNHFNQNRQTHFYKFDNRTYSVICWLS